MESTDDLKTTLEPLPVFISVIAEANDADLLVELVCAAGLRVDLPLSAKDEFSHKTRLRAMVPRVQSAISSLPNDDRLRVSHSWAEIVEARLSEWAIETLARRLSQIGWILEDGQLSPSAQEVRELFFVPGQTHTAWVEIRGIAQECRRRLIVVDAYLDEVLFDLVRLLPTETGIEVHVLTDEAKLRRAVGDLDHMVETFSHEYPRIELAIHKSRGVFHDRFLIVDEKYYHLGASIKDAGRKIFMISRIETPAVIGALDREVAEIVGGSR